MVEFTSNRNVVALVLMTLCSTVWGGASIPDANISFLEEGKTWWYTSSVFSKESGSQVKLFFGIRLDGWTTVDNREWHRCMLVNSYGELLFDYPLALLNEEGGRIMVRPAFEDSSLYNEAKAPYNHLIRRHINLLNPQQTNILNTLSSIDVAKYYPTLLYDFNATARLGYQWPWTSSFTGIAPTTFEVTEVDPCDVQNNQSAYLIRSLEKCEQDDYLEGRIRSEVGLTDMWRAGDEKQNPAYETGVFLTPLDLNNGLATGAFNEEWPEPPVLMKVELKDGSVIYSNSVDYGADYFAEGTVWEVNHGGTSTPEITISLVNYFLDKPDEDGKMVMYMADPMVNTFSKVVYIKRDGEKIRYRPIDGESDDWSLLYDFGIQIGEKETFSLPATDGCFQWGEYIAEAECYDRPSGTGEGTSLSSFDTIELIHGEMNTPELGMKEVWIKGIGSTRGVLSNLTPPIDGIYSQLYRVTSDRQVVYESSLAKSTPIERSRVMVFREDGGLRVRGLCAGESVTLYSLDGKRLATALSADGEAVLTTSYRGMVIIRTSDAIRKAIL